jgi:putative hydrolase of the HAD superfamily
VIDRIISEYVQPISPLATGMTPTDRLEGTIRCILFDIYGTLFISGSGDIGVNEKAALPTQKIDKLLSRYHLSITPQTLLNNLFNAVHKAHLRKRRSGVDFPEIRIDRLWMQILDLKDVNTARHFALEFEMIMNPVYPMPNLEEVLNACRRNDIPMGVVSNAQFYTLYLFTYFLKKDMHTLGFDEDLIFLSYQTGYAKPSLQMFNDAAAALKEKSIPPENTLYVGNDMRNDIHPAQTVGFKAALFAGDKRSLRLRTDDKACRNTVPEAVVTDLRQLIDLVGR